MSALYELSDNYVQLMNLLEADADNQAIKDTLDSVNDTIEIKTENIIKIYKSLKGDVEARKNEITELKNKQASDKKQMERLKDYLDINFQKMNKIKIKTPIATAYISKNPASVQIEDEQKIPEEFIKTIQQIDKAKLKEALSESEVAGAKLIRTESLKIR